MEKAFLKPSHHIRSTQNRATRFAVTLTSARAASQSQTLDTALRQSDLECLLSLLTGVQSSPSVPETWYRGCVWTSYPLCGVAVRYIETEEGARRCFLPWSPLL